MSAKESQPRAHLADRGELEDEPVDPHRGCRAAQAVKTGVGPSTVVRVVVCPPAVFLGDIDTVLDGSPIGLGAQNMHWETAGAFTGELSAAMLVDSGCTHVILGHSERRHGMGETDVHVNRKLHAALAARLIPIVCIGETKDERLANHTESVLLAQLTGSLAGLEPEQMAGTVLAYEPVWAIGTGLDGDAGAGPNGPCIHPQLAGAAVRRGDRGPRGCPVRRERQAGQRRASSWPAPTSTGPWSAAPA